MKIESYPLQTAIELACAAFRANNGYLSERQLMERYNPDETRYTNKELMLVAMGAIDPKKYEDVPNKPVLLCTNLDDKELASQMTKFFKRLMFAAIEGEDQFKVDLFGILNQEEVPILFHNVHFRVPGLGFFFLIRLLNWIFLSAKHPDQTKKHMFFSIGDLLLFGQIGRAHV